MERVVFVEVLGRRGDVVQRVRLAQLPATIGRAWSNDVILSDPHVDGQHARLVEGEAGALVLEDLGSLNGLHEDGRLLIERRIALQPGSTVRIGRTMLRVATADQQVPPAIRDAEPESGVARAWSSPRAIALVLVVSLVIAALSVWLEDYDAKSNGALAGRVLEVVASVAAWAGLWALAGRLIIHRARYWQHLTLACLFGAALWLSGMIGSWGAFLVAPGAALTLEGLLATSVFLAALVMHSGLASAASRGRRVLFAFLLLGGLAVLGWIGETASHDDYGSNVSIGATLKPLPVALVPSRSFDDFMTRTSLMQKALDAEK